VVVEFSLASPRALRALEHAARSTPPGATIGAGTVRSVKDARDAVAAGASFLVSPSVDAEVLQWAVRRDILYIPGVFSPAELESALRLVSPAVNSLKKSCE
jgi:2-dehydro-3-deoxyphosphogluconate aldolase/(4S)-4-hydroxy-2-oxoglutarate aldolase